MRRNFDKFMSIMNAVLSQTGGIDPSTGKERKFIKDRYVSGDNFYNHLPMKRIGGKWRVKR